MILRSIFTHDKPVPTALPPLDARSPPALVENIQLGILDVTVVKLQALPSGYD